MKTGLIPKSLFFQPLIKTTRGKKIAGKISELYLKEWIHVLNKRKRDLIEKISILEASLRKNLTGIDFTRIYQMCVKSAEHIFKITKEKHQQKFELLQKRAICGVSNKHNRAGNSKWVINKSSTKLLPDEEEVLKLGLNFAPTPRTVPVVDLLAGVEVATHNAKLQAEEAEELRARICCVVKNTG